jgi:hypothetical protein
LDAQGFGVKDNIIYQDNMSAMLLEKNGKMSSSKRTRHINIRYFFIADRVAQKEVSIEYCGTDDMIGDFYTKPLQGAKFIKFRDLIMNVRSNVHPPSNGRSVLDITDGNIVAVNADESEWITVRRKRHQNGRTQIVADVQAQDQAQGHGHSHSVKRALQFAIATSAHFY